MSLWQLCRAGNWPPCGGTNAGEWDSRSTKCLIVKWLLRLSCFWLITAVIYCWLFHAKLHHPLIPGNCWNVFADGDLSFAFSLSICAGQSRASSRQRSTVLFSTCHPESVWELCPSRSGGATGSQSAKWMGSTTTSTPNWRVLSASEARPSYGKNVTNTLFSKLFALCAKKLAFCAAATASQRIKSCRTSASHGAYLTVCVGMLHSRNRPCGPCPHLHKSLSLSVTFVCLCSVFLNEQLSQDVAEMLLVVRREVEEDGSWLHPDNTKKWSYGMWHNFA